VDQAVVCSVPLRACVGRHIRRYRQAKGWSQRDLAGVIGKSHQYVSFVEKGTCDITMGTLELVSKALEIPVSAFVAHEDETLSSPSAAV
jgi:transcriptional regulator with XRE-family HTH domain